MRLKPRSNVNHMKQQLLLRRFCQDLQSTSYVHRCLYLLQWTALTAGVNRHELARLAADVVGAERPDTEVIGSTARRGRPPEVGRGATERYRPGQPDPRPDRPVLNHVILCGGDGRRVMKRREPAYQQSAATKLQDGYVFRPSRLSFWQTTKSALETHRKMRI